MYKRQRPALAGQHIVGRLDDRVERHFVAIQGGATVNYVRSDVPPGMKTATDIAKAEGLVVGGLSVDSSKDVRVRMGLDLLGLKYKYVTGYRSSAPARLAFTRNEINVFSESTPSYRSIVVPDLIDTGQAIPVWYDADFTRPSSQMAGLSILPFDDLYKSMKGGPPSGELWDNEQAVNRIDGAMLRTVSYTHLDVYKRQAALRAVNEMHVVAAAWRRCETSHHRRLLPVQPVHRRSRRGGEPALQLAGEIGRAI